MFKWLLCFALLAVTCHACNNMQRLKVKQQWTEAYGFGADRFAIGTALWRSIFKQRPDIIDKFFVRVNGRDISSPKFQAHIARIFGGFDMCISLLDDPATLNANLNHLNGQHVAMGISAEYFNIFRKSLMLAIESTIESCFDADAWDSCTAVISKGIGSGV